MFIYNEKWKSPQFRERVVFMSIFGTFQGVFGIYTYSLGPVGHHYGGRSAQLGGVGGRYTGTPYPHLWDLYRRREGVALFFHFF